MKRLVTLFMVLCMVFSLAACNTGETDGDGSGTPTASGDVSGPTEPKTIALCENWDFESGFSTPLHPGNSAGGHGASYYLPNMYETLVEVKNGEVVPALAKNGIFRMMD